MLLAGGFHLGLHEAVEGEEELVGGSLSVTLGEFADSGGLNVVRFGRVAHRAIDVVPRLVDNASPFLHEEQATLCKRLGGFIHSGADSPANVGQGFEGQVIDRLLDKLLRDFLGDGFHLLLRKRELGLAVVSGDEGLLAVRGADKQPATEGAFASLLDDATSALGDLATLDDCHEATRGVADGQEPRQSVHRGFFTLLAKREAGNSLVGFRGVNHGLELTIGDDRLVDELAVHEFVGREEGELLPDVGHYLDDLAFGGRGEDDGGRSSSGGTHSCVNTIMPNRL